MPADTLTRERILEAAEDVLRRYGPAKANVVDVARARDVVTAHVERLVGQLARMIGDGVARGELEARDPSLAARAVFDATARFHNPAHAPEWSDSGIDDAYESVRSLVLRGLERKRSRGA